MLETLHIMPRRIRYSRWASISLSIAVLAVLSGVLSYYHVPPASSAVLLFLVGALSFYLVYQLNQSGISFSLSYIHLQHHSPKGGWTLKWRNISHIGVPVISIQGWSHPVPWAGFRLKTYAPLLNTISLRLASDIITRQRPLLITAIRKGEKLTDREIEDMLFDDTPFMDEDGQIHRGLVAMLANHMLAMREVLGYDLYTQEELVDRPLEEFIGLSRRYLAAAPTDEELSESEAGQ
ncbi:DUF2982 domain-containing protein [Parasalinivibrio latis]|uniref:DUF2982 domain-containing protein n=1 Tax=Parasalinivibrio latis TaxID=2952610 RepID=UPI0030E0E163